MPASEHLTQLFDAIDACPIIDNHAHPLLKPEYLGKYPLLSITSEAHGDALPDHRNSLPHLRATKQLASLLGCESKWEIVEARIQQLRETDADGWTRKCLSGIETLLLDDGLDKPNEVYEYTWHNTFTRSKCKRIVRIESVAEDIIHRHLTELRTSTDPLEPKAAEDIFFEFCSLIKKYVEDPEVVSFKSIICYRGGLDIPQLEELTAEQTVLAELMTIINGDISDSNTFTQLRSHRLNSLLVHQTAIIIARSTSPFKKPFQFHTGLGDNDITLTKSSPSHLQDFIRHHPTVPIVLLHGGYPWTREMGYLATHYANVYADIGEIFPILSCHGQEAMLRQILELCPWTKILWSTDGHWFPETYALATVQARIVFKSVSV